MSAPQQPQSRPRADAPEEPSYLRSCVSSFEPPRSPVSVRCPWAKSATHDVLSSLSSVLPSLHLLVILPRYIASVPEGHRSNQKFYHVQPIRAPPPFSHHRHRLPQPSLDPAAPSSDPSIPAARSCVLPPVAMDRAAATLWLIVAVFASPLCSSLRCGWIRSPAPLHSVGRV